MVSQSLYRKTGTASRRTKHALGMARAHGSETVLLLTRQVKVPVLLVQAGNDRIVSNLAQKRFIEKLRKTNPHAALLSIEGAQHEILFETDQYRNQALDAIFRFMDDPTSSSDEKMQ